MTSSNETQVKKPYHTPQFTVYGDIRQITQANVAVECFRAIHPEYRDDYVRELQVQPLGAGIDLCGLQKDDTGFPAEISLSPIETVERCSGAQLHPRRHPAELDADRAGQGQTPVIPDQRPA